MGDALGSGGQGVKRYNSDQENYINALISMGLWESMADHVNVTLKWSDVLVERLRSDRGSAISGQKRGRGLEDFVKDVIRRVFDKYEARCKFVGARNQRAKCDFSIPSKSNPHIFIEVKGYGATGSKMSNVVRDYVTPHEYDDLIVAA